MANGPLGGFMPTPASPGQPPQVKLDTSAESRGNFNKFLGTLPKNGAIAPLQTGVMQSSMAPVSPIAGNVNIFQPQMSPMMAMAPMTMPMMPPAQPVAMMQEGGDPMDASFSDFSGFDDSSDPFGGGDSGQEDTSDSFDANMGLSNQEVQDIFQGGDDQPVVLPTSRPEILKQAVDRAEKEIFGGTESDALKFIDDQNNLTASGQKAYEDAIRGNLAELQDPAKPDAGGLQLASFFDNRGLLDGAKSTTAGDISRAAFAGVTPTRSIDTGAKGLESITDLGLDEIDPFDIQPTFQNIGLPGTSGLPNVRSTRSTVAEDQARAIANLVGPKQPTVGELLQQNILADRGRALGPINFRDDAEASNFANINRQTPAVDTVLDLDTTTREQSRVGDDFDTALNLVDRNEADRLAAGQAMGVGTPPLDATNITETALGARGQNVTRSTAPEDFEENVGLPFSDQRMRDIERLINVPEGQRRTGEGDDPNILSGIPSALNIFETIPREQMAIDVALGRPRSLGEMLRGVTAPNLQTETMKQFTDRLQRNIIGPEGDTTSFSAKSIPESQLIRDNRGRITAITDASGRTITGVNPNEQMGGDDNQLPIIRKPIAPIVQPKEDDDKPPNVIGGGVTPTPISQTPSTVVPSKFGPSTASFAPVGFNTGDLNDLIARITGISSPRRMQEGGIVNAVDNFLNKVA